MKINFQGQVYRADFAKAIKLHNGRIVLVQKIIFGIFLVLGHNKYFDQQHLQPRIVAFAIYYPHVHSSGFFDFTLVD